MFAGLTSFWTHCILLLLLSLGSLALLFFDPGTQFPGNEKKLRYAIQKKYKNQGGVNLAEKFAAFGMFVCISFMCLLRYACVHVGLIQPLAARNNKRCLFVTLLLLLL